jgi:hypothetical protein
MNFKTTFHPLKGLLPAAVLKALKNLPVLSFVLASNTNHRRQYAYVPASKPRFNSLHTIINHS